MAAPKVEANSGRFRKGRTKTGGRRRGIANRATRAWKDFVVELVNDPEQQAALADAIKAHPEMLFRAAEHAVGKPRQAVDLDHGVDGKIEIRWRDDLATRLQAARKRVADARDPTGDEV